MKIAVLRESRTRLKFIRAAAHAHRWGAINSMKMSEAKWLKWYSWFIIVCSAVETAVFVSGGFLEKITLSAFSCMTIVLGLVACYFIIGGHFAFAKLARSITGPKYSENIEDITTILFWIGLVASGAVVLTNPFFWNDGLSFSIAPVGIGFSAGARWIHGKYHQSEVTDPNQANAADAKSRAAD